MTAPEVRTPGGNRAHAEESNRDSASIAPGASTCAVAVIDDVGPPVPPPLHVTVEQALMMVDRLLDTIPGQPRMKVVIVPAPRCWAATPDEQASCELTSADEDHQQYVRDTADALLDAARALRRVMSANIPPCVLMQVLTEDQQTRIDTERLGTHFIRNLLDWLRHGAQ